MAALRKAAANEPASSSGYGSDYGYGYVKLVWGHQQAIVRVTNVLRRAACFTGH
jgi:hypothetical protein